MTTDGASKAENSGRAPAGALILEPDRTVRDLLVRLAAKERAEVQAVATPAEALALAGASERIDLFLLDLPPGTKAFAPLLEVLHLRHPFAAVIGMTSLPSEKLALAALRAGACDLLVKPFPDTERVGKAIRKGLDRSRVLHEIALGLPDVVRFREEAQNLRRERERLQGECEAQVRSFEESQEIFYLDLSRMMTIIDNIMDGILFTDRDARINLINPVAERYLGVRSFVAIGQQVGELTGREELLCVVAEDQSRVLEEDTVSRTVEIHDSRDDLVYIKVTTTAVTDYRGNFAGLLTLMQDVTAEFKADQLKNQYLSIVSHELRTPLTGIKTYVTMMSRGVLGAVDERQGRVLETIRDQTLRLEHHIDKLISLGMLEQEDFAQDFQVFAAPEVVGSAVAPFEQEVKDRELSLSVQLPPGAQEVYLKADKDNIKRVLQALLENAVKFNRRGGRVAVTVVAGPEEILFRVSDTGIGIDPRYHRRIFEKFFQVEDPLTRQHGGAGLGLTVAERILRSHRSQMSLESSLGQGATFQFSLKRYQPAQKPKAVREPAESGPRERSVR